MSGNSMVAPGDRRRARRSTWLPDTAYVAVAGLEASLGLVGLAFAAFPPTSAAPRALDLALGVFLLLLATLTLVVAPRIPDGWGLDASLLVFGTIQALGAAGMNSAMGQAQAGLTLLLTGVVAAYFRPRRRVWAMLAWWVSLFAVAVIVHPHTGGPLNAMFLIAVIVAVPLVVSNISQRLLDQALRDPLTGLLNRRGLNQASAHTLSMAARAGLDVTVGMLDLDDFKGFNDRHGHIAGDEFLAALADDWEDQLRQGDLLARIGGDEFAVVLPGSSMAQAESTAERLRQANTAAFTAGFTTWLPEEDLLVALDRADASLYAAKRRTR